MIQITVLAGREAKIAKSPPLIGSFLLRAVAVRGANVSAGAKNEDKCEWESLILVNEFSAHAS